MSVGIRLLCIVFIVPIMASAQGSAWSLESKAYHLIDRLEIKSGLNAPFNTTLRPYERGAVAAYLNGMDTLTQLSSLDFADLRWFNINNSEWVQPSVVEKTLTSSSVGVLQQTGSDSLGPIYRQVAGSQIEACMANERFEHCQKPLLRYFYRTPGNWLELNKPALHLRINPLANFQVAKQNDGELLFTNQRGLEIRGGVDDRIYFYTNFSDTQARFPNYVNESIQKNKAIPHNGYYKDYKSSVFDSNGAYDFNNGQGHIGFLLTPHVGLEFGHGRNFIGHGFRSLLLSDFSHNYLYLKAKWQLWRFTYQNLFAELQATSAQNNPSESLIPRKYMAAHYLGLRLTEKLTAGFFEATIFNRDSSEGNFELQYLNPVILYRTVEHLLDSKDNIVVGTDFKWNLLKRFRIYGQFVLDEFKFSELRARNGWWANKFGYQLGGLYIDALGIDHLDLRGEYNTVRPYTYTHSGVNGASYSHYNQALAHPLGANFKEMLATATFRPTPKWSFEGRFIHAKYGEDDNSVNYGGNILLDYGTRPMEYNNETGQGVSTTTNLLGLNIAYEVWHNVFIETQYFYRKKQSALPERNGKDTYFGGGLRWNLSSFSLDF